MAWLIKVSAGVRKELRKLDPPVTQRIIAFLRDRVQPLDDPRSIGEALQGKKYGEFWKYRVGDMRIIARIEDRELMILVVRVGHRKQVYR